MVKNHLPTQETQETRVQSLGQEDHQEEGLAPHSSIPAWEILWTEEPGKSCGQRSVAGYSPWGRKGSAMTECLSMRAQTHLGTLASPPVVCSHV